MNQADILKELDYLVRTDWEIIDKNIDKNQIS